MPSQAWIEHMVSETKAKETKMTPPTKTSKSAPNRAAQLQTDESNSINTKRSVEYNDDATIAGASEDETLSTVASANSRC